jgi:predicted transcriptional regulator of viral defense system
VTVTARSELWDVAVDQYGYFTVQDALDLGIDQAALRMVAARDKVAHVAHGVYRFPELPATEFDPFMLAVLWTGTTDACLSHDTALANYDVCDINPDRIHLTVPKARRIRRRGGELYVVHYADLAADQLGWWHRIRTVTLPTAIAQCITSGVPTYLLRQALTAGRDRGLLTAGEAKTLTADLEARDAR